jgi:hypothetical protein
MVVLHKRNASGTESGISEVVHLSRNRTNLLQVLLIGNNHLFPPNVSVVVDLLEINLSIFEKIFTQNEQLQTAAGRTRSQRFFTDFGDSRRLSCNTPSVINAPFPLSSSADLLQTIGCEHTCNVSCDPSSCVSVVLKIIRHLVDFFLLLLPSWSGNLCSTSTFRSLSMPTQSHVALISFEGSSCSSMTHVPSTFFSTQGVEFLPLTLHAW